ncbi:MAG: HEAT repeat domain-containing protein [Planctomycetes bacterium]|nr:HEAT repeat domain-containing protein [Planctomycetota bacterium]
MSARRPLIRAPLLVAFVATMSLGAVQLVRNWPEAKAPPEPRLGTVAWLAQLFETSRDKAEPADRAETGELTAALRANLEDRDAATLAMLELTRDPRASMRAAALGRCSSARNFLDDLQPSTVDAIRQRCVELLDDEARAVRLAALSVYVWSYESTGCRTCAPEVMAFLGSLLRASDEADRGAAYMACYFVDEESASLLPLLLQAPPETSKSTAFAAVLAVQGTGVKTLQTMLWLRERLSHPEPDVRSVAASAIGGLGEPGALLAPELLALLADDGQRDDVARSAAGALAELPIPTEIADEALTLFEGRAQEASFPESHLVTLGQLAQRASAAAAAPIHAMLKTRTTGKEVWEELDAYCALAHLVCTHGTDAERQRLADALFAAMLEDQFDEVDLYLLRYADALVALANAPRPPQIDLPLLRAAIECTIEGSTPRDRWTRRLLASLPQ